MKLVKLLFRSFKDFDNYSYIDLVYEQVNRKSDIAASQGSLDAMGGPLICLLQMSMQIMILS